MRLATSCPICLEARLATIEIKKGGVKFFSPIAEVGVGEFGEDLIAICVCAHGHKFRVTHHSVLHFDLLTHTGLQAFSEAFYGESVMNLMAALENAFGYFCQVIFFSNGGSFEAFDEAWSALGKQSERRLGWFSAVWLLETGRVFRMPGKRSQFRNDVIHNGVIPSQAQALDFGEWVIASLYDILEALKPKHEKSMTKCHFYNGKKRSELVKSRLAADKELQNLPDGPGIGLTILGTNYGPQIFRRRSIDELLATVQKTSLLGVNPKLYHSKKS